MTASPEAGADLPLRDSFLLPRGIYLDGHSLGPASLAAQAAIQRRFRQWHHHAIGGWDEWFGLAERLRPALAKLMGAHSDEVIPTGGLTVNLHTVLAGLYRPTPQRSAVVALANEFPSDLYALRSWTERHGAELRLVAGCDEEPELVEETAIEAALEEDVAFAWLPVVTYRAGQVLDVARLSAAAKRAGVMIGFDAAHSVGVVPHDLHESGVDVAVWCSYKYLCAGPGAPGGLFLHRRHHGRAPGLPGWWGHDKASQFEMHPTFTPGEGAAAWQIGTPSVLALAGLEGALGIFEAVGIQAIRTRSLALTERLIEAVRSELPELQVVTPRVATRRGGHVTVRHPQARTLSAALRQREILADHRPPDLLRIAPVALYNDAPEVDRSVAVLRELLREGPASWADVAARVDSPVP